MTTSPHVLPLSYKEIRSFLQKLGTELERIILVGGQAVNFWSEQYLERVPALQAEAPYASKDIDFAGDQRAVRACAARLGGQALLPQPFEPTPNSGIVVFVDDAGSQWTIDFLAVVAGVNDDRLKNMAIPAELENEDGSMSGIELRVMHPLLCLKSRTYNVINLPGYQTPHALKQFRASVFCMREFLIDMLNDGYVREVLELHEQIFWHAWTKDGIKAAHLGGAEPFSAIVLDPRLPEKFRTVRYPQMKALLEKRRAHVLRKRNRPVPTRPQGSTTS